MLLTFLFPCQSPFHRLGQQMQDLLGDGGIQKEVVQPGEGLPVPRDSSVSINFSGFLEYSDQPFEITSHLKYPRMMKLGRAGYSDHEEGRVL
uniref:Uncharacterized protein n=1 Tax=Hucho hucho TaxID=62062 RepID=A0A4W5M1S7_9TELE